MTYPAQTESLADRQEALLTIAIPTFNRNDILRGTLERLLPQLTSEVRLVVIDNASDVPVAHTITSLIEGYPQADIRLIENKWNIGADANILRCFEQSDTEYIWVLGDDDQPLPNAVETVLQVLREHPSAIFFNFASELCQRSEAFTSQTLDELIAMADSFLNMLFISTSIYRRRIMITHIQHGYHFTYTMAAHLVLLLYALQEAPGECLFLQSQIVKNTTPVGGIRWSGVGQMLGLGLLLDLPLDNMSRKRLARLMTSPRALEFITVQLLGYKVQSGDDLGAAHAMDQIYRRLLVLSGRLTTRVKFFLYRYCLFAFPSIGLALFSFLVKSTGRGREALYFRDPFRRAQHSKTPSVHGEGY